MIETGKTHPAHQIRWSDFGNIPSQQGSEHIMNNVTRRFLIPQQPVCQDEHRLVIIAEKPFDVAYCRHTPI